jgi:hypothetical protein
MLRVEVSPARDLIWNVIVPVVQWGAAALIVVGLAYWLAGVLRRMDEVETPGHRPCPNCGYDIRATPRRCPECGREIPPQESEPAAPDREYAMPIYTIPPDSGPFAVVRGPDGGFAVAEERTVGDHAQAAKLGFIFIPCRDEAQARALADRLNRGEHDGTVQVDLLAVAPGAEPPAPEKR